MFANNVTIVAIALLMFRARLRTRSEIRYAAQTRDNGIRHGQEKAEAIWRSCHHGNGPSRRGFSPNTPYPLLSCLSPKTPRTRVVNQRHKYTHIHTHKHSHTYNERDTKKVFKGGREKKGTKTKVYARWVLIYARAIKSAKTHAERWYKVAVVRVPKPKRGWILRL